MGHLGQVGEFELIASLLWFAALAVILHFLLNNSRFGNWITATGGNVKAAPLETSTPTASRSSSSS